MNIVSLVRKAVGDAVSDNISGAIIKENSHARRVTVGGWVRASCWFARRSRRLCRWP